MVMGVSESMTVNPAVPEMYQGSSVQRAADLGAGFLIIAAKQLQISMDGLTEGGAITSAQAKEKEAHASEEMAIAVALTLDLTFPIEDQRGWLQVIRDSANLMFEDENITG